MSKEKKRDQDDSDIIEKKWFDFFDSDCTGTHCSQTRFEFLNADLQNLKYRYRDAQGRISEGVLGPRNNDYIFSWFFSLFLRLMFPPFSGAVTACSKGCRCLYGPEFSDTEDYVHVYEQEFSQGRRIEIRGKFEVRVVVRMGVCIPKKDSVFGRIGEAGDANPCAAAAAVDGAEPVVGSGCD